MSNWLEKLQNRNRAGHQMGTGQDDRRLAALNPDHVSIAETDLVSFVHFLREYSGILAFYDQENRLAGSWQDMLDQSALLSLIDFASLNRDEEAERFHSELEHMQDLHSRGLEVDLLGSNAFKMVWEMFDRVQRLKLATRRLEKFNAELRNLIHQNLASARRQYQDLIDSQLVGAQGQVPAYFDQLKTLDGDWRANDTRNAAQSSRRQDFAEDLKRLTEIFMQTLQVVGLIQDSAQKSAAADMKGGEVLPHVALLMGFFEMMKVAYKDLNNFSARHLNYYYQDILRLKYRGAEADKAHVVFTLAENVNNYSLEAGTRLSAGVDSSGKPRTYILDRTIGINKAQLASIKAIIHDEILPTAPLLPATGLPVDTYVISTAPKSSMGDWAQQTLRDGDRFFRPGFAISASVWHVDPTHAMLKMQLDCEEDTFRDFIDALDGKWIAKNRKPVNSKVTNADRSAYVRTFLNAEYSIEGGAWHGLHPDRVELTVLGEPQSTEYLSTLVVTLLLEPGDPAITACTLPQYPEAMQQGLPVFRFLATEEHLDLYKLFSQVIVEEVELHASVLDVRSLILQNDFSLLDPNVPFQPFGPFPTLGANFYVGHQRLFDHPLEALKVNIEWYQLPTEKFGFAGHYAQYGFEGNNHSFMALLSILDRKQWWPKERRQALSLFQSASPPDDGRPNPVDRLSKIRRINEVDMARVRLPRAKPGPRLVTYDKETLRGFLRLQLAEPVMAFGHQLYPEVLTRQITEATRRKKPIPTVNQPYTPTIKSISLDYYSIDRFSLKRPEAQPTVMFYHVHPFGVMQMNAMVARQSITLLPKFSLGSHLYLGIENWQAQAPISILFQISDEGALDYAKPPNLTWYYLSGGQWIPLRVQEQLFDSTAGMCKSGLMGFRIEEPIDRDLKLLPNDLTWLSCVSDIGTQFLSQLIDIKLQATSCTLDLETSSTEHLSSSLPAGTIGETAAPEVAIAAVNQPYATWGGRAPETAQEYYTRVSELLRHKDRGITGWDFEALILERFPEVRKVISLSHLDEQGVFRPGDVLLTVIPRMLPQDRERFRITRVSAGRIDEIQQYVQSRSSEFARIRVTNAVVERLMVSAAIRFKPGYDDQNFYLNKLNKGLQALLSPWYYQDDLSSGVAAKVYASSVIDYIDSQYFVDYVANFRLFHLVNGIIVNPTTANGQYEIVNPRQPNSVLLSVERHALSVLGDEPLVESGIEAMTTEVTLSVPFPIPAEDGIETVIVQKDLTIPGAEPPPLRNFTIRIKTGKT